MRLFKITLLWLGLYLAFPLQTFAGRPYSDPPIINCPGDLTVNSEVFACGATVNYTVTADDDLPGWSLAQNSGIASGQFFPIGNTVNVFTVTDSDGNSATCAFTVTVIDDVPPVAACDNAAVVNVAIGPNDDPNDCYDGHVVSIYAQTFDDGSYDNCGSDLKYTIRRLAPYNSCINGLNPVNGHPDCSDSNPDAESEYELATGEHGSIKFYCDEAGIQQFVILRVYQLNGDGSVSLDLNGNPIYSECFVNVEVVSTVLCTAPDTTAQLLGKIQLDANGDCQTDAVQFGLQNMIVQAKTTTGDVVYTVTGTDGAYNINNLPEGATEVNVLPFLPIWSVCNNQTSVNIPAGQSQTNLDFNALPAINCPFLTVDMATIPVQPCQTNKWPVSYCNKGNVTAENATVQVTVAAPLNLLGANNPFSISGDVMTVQIGDVPPGVCGSFEADIATPCDPNLVGSTVCVKADISPESYCLPSNPQWSGAQITASGVCEGDSVQFTLQNKGTAPTSQSLDFVIIDDMVVMFESSIPAGLGVGAFVTFRVAAPQGHALRLQAEQEPGHPIAQAPSILVENCNGQSLGNYALEFSNEDGNSFTDHECRPVVALGPSNRISAFPQGSGAQHLINAYQRLEYQVDFQNEAGDTAFLVVIRDTISNLLNPADLRMGAASHPYTWSLSGQGVLEIRFEPIYLPPANAGNQVSRGFVQFDIAQKAENQVGTVIINSADIYYDIEKPIKSNTVWHTVGTDLIATGTSIPALKAAPQLQVYPNPASEQTYLVINAEKQVQVRLIDVFGHVCARYAGKAPGIMLHRNGLPTGLYYLEVNEGAGWNKTGKLSWQ